MFLNLLILRRLLELECYVKAFRRLGYNQTCKVHGLGGVEPVLPKLVEWRVTALLHRVEQGFMEKKSQPNLFIAWRVKENGCFQCEDLLMWTISIPILTGYPLHRGAGFTVSFIVKCVPSPVIVKYTFWEKKKHRHFTHRNHCRTETSWNYWLNRNAEKKFCVLKKYKEMMLKVLWPVHEVYNVLHW